MNAHQYLGLAAIAIVLLAAYCIYLRHWLRADRAALAEAIRDLLAAGPLDPNAVGPADRIARLAGLGGYESVMERLTRRHIDG